MIPRLRRYVLLALLLTVPLQGLAAMVHALSCVQHDGHAAMAGSHGHGGGDHGASHHHPDESNGAGSDHNGHQCCHHFPAAPVDVSIGAHDDHAVFHPSAAAPGPSAVLERPQRPPRS
jgi:hypothetical protein